MTFVRFWYSISRLRGTGRTARTDHPLIPSLFKEGAGGWYINLTGFATSCWNAQLRLEAVRDQPGRMIEYLMTFLAQP